ncbi:mechanosensitive ion channel family protein [Imtechella halotolerans]|uniref:Mechanosensitive ion channel protein MscS n=1 Tax=Imtechella halotolerans K1 TaxID=946077 RepID=I0WI46_9FLAO|nr:mechanosensitive ion channel protein MscS [Imtechella halotolerans K1]
MEKLQLSLNDTKNLVSYLIEKMYEFIPNLISAVLILVVGLWMIGMINKVFKKMMVRREVEITLRKFLANLINWLLKALLFIVVIQKLGVQNSSFVAILGAAGLAVGLALQGSLSNFAGGVLILLFKPFKVGDFIEAKGIKGTVKEISIFSTSINTFGNELAIVPNGPLYNDNIINYSKEENRRANIIAGIGYSSDIKKAKEILLEIARSNEKILQDPAPVVYVAELADSSVNLSLRFWSKNEDYWDMYFFVMEEIKLRFDQNGIEIPFPQRDIYVKKSYI